MVYPTVICYFILIIKYWMNPNGKIIFEYIPFGKISWVYIIFDFILIVSFQKVDFPFFLINGRNEEWKNLVNYKFIKARRKSGDFQTPKNKKKSNQEKNQKSNAWSN